MLVKSRLVITLIVLLITLIAATAKAQASQNTQIILNLLNGQQYFGVPHIYQGDNGTFPIGPTNKWPVYYGPNNASQYWSQGNINSNQPVLELVPGPGSSGAMFWSETYSGGSVTITIQATNARVFWGGAPFQVYLFLKPTTWGISPQYNYSIPYRSIYPSPVGGDVISPQSSTPYLIIQWAPVWQTGAFASGATGQWNVWIVSNPSGNNASVGPSQSPNLGYERAGWEGIGTGHFQPNPGDLINITVTYDPNTNTLSGVATDLSACVLVLLNKTVQTICPKATFTLNLSGYFTPPSSGNYVFGVGAATLDYGGNGALLYVATTQQTTTPPTPSSSLIVQAPNLIPYFYNSSAGGGVYLNFTKAELGLFMPPVMLGNLSIPGILDFNNMSYFDHTLEGPYVFSTTLGGWKVYGFTFISLPTYGNGSVVNPTYMLQKTMMIAYNGGKVIALLYYRNLAPVSLELNQYWSHIHKGVDGLVFTVYPASFNPYANATEQVIRDAYYIVGNTSLYVDGNYLGQLNSFGLWQVLPVGPITLINNAGGWIVQLIPMDDLSTTQQIQLVTNGFSINGVRIANSFFNIQHAEVTLMPNQSAQYVYSIGINTQPPDYTEIRGILSYLLQIASSSNPQNTSSSSSLAVQVFNVLGRPATTVPGVVFGVLYNSGFSEVAYMNSSGYLNFNNLTPGTYILEVYHYPNLGLNLTEYWGGMTVSLQPGSNFVTFYRHEPWIYDLQAVRNGARISINVTVNNPLNATLHGKLYIWVTTSPQTANPSEPTIDTSATSITIGPGLNKFTYYYATTQKGTYYVYATLLIYKGTQLVTTDQWNWTAVKHQLTFVITSYAPSVSFELYESNNYFSQGQIITSNKISGGLQTIQLNLPQGIYEYNLSLNSQGYTIVPSPTGFINLTKNEKIYLIVTPLSDSYTVNMTPVGLPDPSQWYGVWNDTIILAPEKNGAIPVSLFIGPNKNTIDLKFYSTNPQYYPLLPIVQLNATSVINGVTYVIPFATSGYAHIVDWNGVQWNPLLNEYSQKNPIYVYHTQTQHGFLGFLEWWKGNTQIQDGFCWGMSSTAILYYLGFLPLPSQGAKYTSQLYLGPKNTNGYLEYLTDAALAVAVHQILDPLNQGTKIIAAPADNIASTAIYFIGKLNQPVILIINFTNQNGNSLYVGSGYHAVVAWGYVQEPNKDVVFLVYDPNYPQIITRAIYNPTNGSFIYIDGGPPYSTIVNGQTFRYPGDVGEVIEIAPDVTPAGLWWFSNPDRFKIITKQQVQILQGGLLDYTLYVSEKPLIVRTGGELAGYFVDNKYFVTAPTVQPGKLAGYVDGYPSSHLYIVAVRNDFNALVDPNSTLVALRFANVSGNVMVYGFVANSTEPIAVQFVNQTSFIMASRNNTAVKLELFSATSKSVKTYNTTLRLTNGTGYVVSANFTSLTNVTIKTVTMSWENIAPTQTATTTTTSITTTTTTTTASVTTIATTTATGASGIQPPPLVVVPTPQSTAAANGQIRQIGALQIATWALVGVAAFLLAYLLSGFVLSRKQ